MHSHFGVKAVVELGFDNTMMVIGSIFLYYITVGLLSSSSSSCIRLADMMAVTG